MTVKFTCPNCKTVLQAAKEKAGDIASCSVCKKLMRIPNYETVLSTSSSRIPISAGNVVNATQGQPSKVVLGLSSLALRAVSEYFGKEVGNTASDAIIKFLTSRFIDQSEQLSRALYAANDQTWKIIELALENKSSWWTNCKKWLSRGDEKAFENHLRRFLNQTQPQFRQRCLRELQKARKLGLLTEGNLDPEELAHQTAIFARAVDPTIQVEADLQKISQLSELFRQYEFTHLAWLVAYGAIEGSPLLVNLVRYFFRQAVVDDDKLSKEWSFLQFDQLKQGQKAIFEFQMQKEHLDMHRHKEILDGQKQNNETLKKLESRLLNLEIECRSQPAELIQRFYQPVIQLEHKLNLEGNKLSSGASHSIRSDVELEKVKAFLTQYRSLPTVERQKRPALLNAVGKLEVAAGEFEKADMDFKEVAALVTDQHARAEAHYNRYQSFLEKKDWASALSALHKSVDLSPQNFEPFPFSKYEPLKILGTGGFSVAFLCRHRTTGGQVVVKTLMDNNDQDIKQTVKEAEVLEALEHPALVRIRDCDYADTDQMRAYLVEDYFDVHTLQRQIDENGPMTVEEFIPIAKQIAQGMIAAHARNVLHRFETCKYPVEERGNALEDKNNRFRFSGSA